MRDRYTRRELIVAGSVGAVAAIAGCSGSEDDPSSGGSPEEENEPSQQSVFQDIEVGTELTISVEDSDVEDVRIAGPDGSMVARQSPGEMDDTVTVDLLSGYSPGQHTIEAVDSEGEVIGTETVSIEPEINFTDFGFDSQYEELREQDTSWSSRPVFHVENTGNGPDVIQQIHASGEYVSGTYAPSLVVEFDEPFEQYAVSQEEQGVTVAPGETKRVRVEKELAAFGTPCEGGVKFEFTPDLVASEGQQFTGVVENAEPDSGSEGDPSLRIGCEFDSELE